jgi:hypothetical protein
VRGRRTLGGLLAIASAGALAACGGSTGSSPDAAGGPADAAACSLDRCGEECVDLTSSHQHCGACGEGCTPAQRCETSECACPSIEITPAGFVLSQMDLELQAPAILGIGIYSDEPDLDALVIGFLADSPLDTPIDLATTATGGAPFVGLGYRIDIATQTYTAAYRATSGTLTLTRRCAKGVAGSLAGVALVEVDPAASGVVLVDGGCTTAIAELAFSHGGACDG